MPPESALTYLQYISKQNILKKPIKDILSVKPAPCVDPSPTIPKFEDIRLSEKLRGVSLECWWLISLSNLNVRCRIWCFCNFIS